MSFPLFIDHSLHTHTHTEEKELILPIYDSLFYYSFFLDAIRNPFGRAYFRIESVLVFLNNSCALSLLRNQAEDEPIQYILWHPIDFYPSISSISIHFFFSSSSTRPCVYRRDRRWKGRWPIKKKEKCMTLCVCVCFWPRPRPRLFVWNQHNIRRRWQTVAAVKGVLPRQHKMTSSKKRNYTNRADDFAMSLD